MNKKIYDVAIIGGGPAGLTAAIYALRSGRSVVVMEKLMVGGQVALTQDISNYPAFNNINGFELSQKMHEQAQNLGAETVYAEVTNANLHTNPKTLFTTDGEILAKSVIIATGAKSRKLGIDNEDALMGGGLAYCAVCDGAFYKGKNVAVVGGGNSGVEDALYLAKLVNHVTLIHNKDELVAHKITVDQLHEWNKNHGNVTIISNSTVSGLGGMPLNSIEINNLKTGEKSNLEVSGLFVAIGRLPDTEFLKGKVDMNKWGYILSNQRMHTSVEGVFVAGDVRESVLKQIVTATADGSVAATSADIYLNSLK